MILEAGQNDFTNIKVQLLFSRSTSRERVGPDGLKKLKSNCW